MTRFAPSPTGRLHIGHGWSALQAHDFARENDGTFLLRIEDTDVTRCRPEFTEGIYEDLRWLGIGWDGLVIQSARFDAYEEALDRLKATGVVYPCFCTRGDIARELAASLHAPHGADGPLYPGTCRALSPDERAARIAAGDPHSWRLDMGAALARTGPLAWQDDFAGTVPVEPDALGDLIIKGRDRPASYHLAVVVDDAAQGVTHVIRGRDVFASTHAHRTLQALLGLPSPRYRHHRLIVDAAGKRLAKRADGLSLAELRDQGLSGPALAEDLRAGRFPVGIRVEAS
ncbi:glutamyl-Q tRNA(Asp) synthetase [Sphingobium xanthum]|nr:glutamyl-Q tRNA(Asp) synthetase [Sphingobium sp. B10D3B]MCW2402505.1 glutamyl-Q tRNA(Asp) synthetase [Sphingobium sp. B10D7B]MCW2409484.1 glutamyl-Q tRNA(Asp) synthetase [Sphingobium xanthum]